MNNRDAKKKQQDFFSNMTSAFIGTENPEGAVSENSIVGQLKAAADDLRAASDMLRQSSSAQPSYGGPNGGRPSFNGDGTHRPKNNRDYSMDQGYNGYAGLRRSLAMEAAARYGSTGGIFERGNTYQAHYDRNGGIEYYSELDQKGNVVGLHGRGNQEVAKGYARQQRAQGISQLGSTPTPFYTGSGEGAVHTPGISTAQHVLNSTVGKIPGVGGAIAGVIGGILGAPDAILNGIVNQRAKNAQYQAILGGTNWGTGTHQRWLEENFKLSQLYSGGLTGSMSVEAFRGVTGLGYTGNARDQSLGLITSNYKNLGMSVADSLKFVSLMAQSSSTSFESLKTILNQVGDAAKNTGQNLELARNNLSNLFSISQNTLGGRGALQSSGLVGAYQTQLGRNFANVDFSGLMPGANPGLTALQASSVGMSMSQYELTMLGGGGKARDLQKTADDNLTAMSVRPYIAQIMPVANKVMQQRGGRKSISANQTAWDQYVQAVEQDPGFATSGLNVMALINSIKVTTGADMQPHQAIDWLLHHATGVGSSFNAVDKAQQHSMLQTHERVHTIPAAAAHGGTPNRAGGAGHIDPNRVGDGRVHNVTHDPMLDRFKGKFDNQDYHVIVQTKNGPRVVSGQYAFAHMKDQIAKGTAKFIGGDYDGQSVKDVVGGGYGESNYKGTDTTKVSGGDKTHFRSVADWEKNHHDKVNGAAGGKVIIAPNPALAQLLNITATGNAVVANEGARYGLVPRPGQVGPN